MRFIYLVEIPFLDYKHLLHAHSHVAMLGWGFLAVSGALLFVVLEKAPLPKVIHQRILWLNVIAGVGMAIFFTYQGYGPLSIGFSTIHLIGAYYFAWHFLKKIRTLPNSSARPFAKWAVYWMLISTLGLWSIAPISATLGKLHPLYFASIQFFLHFQFNGWFTFAILALLIWYVEKRDSSLQIPKAGFILLQLSLVLTYTLSITWSTPETFLFYLNSLGVVLQLLAFFLILHPLLRHFLFKKRDISSWLLAIGLLSLMFKVIIQTAVAAPFIAEISYTIRNFVVGFIHLTMLGSISLTLLALLIRAGYFPVDQSAKLGYGMLSFAFIATEVLLFTQGLMFWMEAGFMWAYYEIIFGATALLPLALLFITWSMFRKNPKYKIAPIQPIK